VRADQQAYEDMNKQLDLRRHIIKGNAVWNLPDAPQGFGRLLGYVLNDWQLSGVLTAGSSPRYDLTYTYQNNGAAVNLTGSPDYNARIVLIGDPGSGCSDNQYAQFNTAAVTGPQYNSVGLESGRNYMRGCTDKRVDLAIARDIRMGGSRSLQFRLDIFNAFNTTIITGRNNSVTYVSPTNLTVVNSQYRADGSLDPARLTPRNAGFGAATTAMDMRNLQMQIRFSF
jgi:hypothetical protein